VSKDRLEPRCPIPFTNKPDLGEGSRPWLNSVGDTTFSRWTHAALNDCPTKCGQVRFMIRAKPYGGLRTGKMSVCALAEDEKLKLVLPKACYCGATSNVSVDHLIPSKRGGPNEGENVVWSCKS
jgi:hypothetical protein